MMVYLDILLVFAAAILMGVKQAYFGFVVAVLGLAVLFQLQRSRLLIGDCDEGVGVKRKTQAGILSIFFSILVVSPLKAMEGRAQWAIEMDHEGFFPLTICALVLAIASLVALVAERNKR